MDKRYHAIMILHALGDTIGFKNGDWEFNYQNLEKLEVLDYVNEMIYEFIDLGGVNGIDLKNWRVSDDTFFHIAIAKSLLKYNNNMNKKFFNVIKDNLSDEALRMSEEENGKYKDPRTGELEPVINRYVGITTQLSIDKFTDNFDARNDTYNSSAGGNGAAMRSLVIGMCFYGESHRDTLINISVNSSQLTHNNAYGYLAGFNAALFTALALENVEIEKWPFILIKYLNSKKLKKYISLDDLDEAYDYNLYIRYWQKYIDTKFDKKQQPLHSRSYANPMYRIRYFYENFHKGTDSLQIGASGFLCMIMAYDALLDCGGFWEKLIVYAILHSGDSDTIGAVAGGLYGAVYGMGDAPKKMLKYVERKDELENLAQKLYKKYYKENE